MKIALHCSELFNYKALFLAGNAKGRILTIWTRNTRSLFMTIRRKNPPVWMARSSASRPAPAPRTARTIKNLDQVQKLDPERNRNQLVQVVRLFVWSLESVQESARVTWSKALDLENFQGLEPAQIQKKPILALPENPYA